MFILFLSGCSALSSGNAVTEASQFLRLDGDFEAEASIEKGETVALDMRKPEKSGYAVVGASFDPKMLALVNYLVYDDEGQGRVQYMFQALVNGTSDVLVKMEPKVGGETEVFKRVTVHVGEDDSFF